MERFTFLCCQCRTYRCVPCPKDGRWRLPKGWWFAAEVSEEHPCVFGSEHSANHQPIYCATCRPVPIENTHPDYFWRWRNLPEEDHRPGARLRFRHPKARTTWVQGTYTKPDPDQWGWHWAEDTEGNSWLLTARELYVPADD